MTEVMIDRRGARRAQGGQGLAAAAQPRHHLHHGEDGDIVRESDMCGEVI